MKILVIDRDGLCVQRIRTKLEPFGHSVTEDSGKNSAVDRLSQEQFDVVILDPSPLTSARPVVLSIRRVMRVYPYIFLASETIPHDEALKCGVNDLIVKPFDAAVLPQKIENAERLIGLARRLGDVSEDFPSAGGVIAKSAINQLFLSALDRADRYGEQSFLLQIALNNYREIRDMDGAYAAEHAVASLCKYVVFLRRQSDIIGQSAKNEYTLLLQRPIYETEPMEAANRFAESLSKFGDISSSGSASAEIVITLLEIPSGKEIIRHRVVPKA
jgi:CheY-like chemotaxis protein